MRRREFISLLNGAAAWPLIARAQQASDGIYPKPGGKTPRIGILWHAGSAEEEAVFLRAVRQGLSDFGYVEGKNIVLENRFPAEKPERFISLAAELVALDVDILVAITRLGALAAQRATNRIPIVFVFVPDPVGSKLVASLARPGGNITGLSNFAHDVTAKRIELLKAFVPSVSRVALLVNPSDKDNARKYVEEAQAAGGNLGLMLQAVEIKDAADLVPAFSKMDEDKVDGVVGTQDGLFYVERKNIADLAIAHRLPLVMYSRETVEAGALGAYGPNTYNIFRRAGFYVDKIIKGAAPADLPVEQPTKLEFIINLKTAKTLGLTIPPTLLARADEVID